MSMEIMNNVSANFRNPAKKFMLIKNKAWTIFLKFWMEKALYDL